MRYVKSEPAVWFSWDDIMEAEEELAQSALIDPRLAEWVRKIRQEFIMRGFFEEWYAMDGRWGRVTERKSKGGYLFKQERSAFLLWLRLGTDDAANKLWHETENMLKVLNMDFSEHLTRMMFPLFSRRDVAVIFEVVGLQSGETKFSDFFPFLGPPPWFQLLNLAIFNRFFDRLPVYRLDFTHDLKLSDITFLSPSLPEGARIWLTQRVAAGYEKLVTEHKRAGEHLSWWLLRQLHTPMGTREIARKFGRAPSTVYSAIKSVDNSLLDEESCLRYLSAAPALGLSLLEAVQIASPLSNDSEAEPISAVELILLLKNVVDVGCDIADTENYSKLGICPISGNPLAIFVHQK